MTVYLLYKFTTDIEKAHVDSVWDIEGGASKRSEELIKNKFHVYIVPSEVQSDINITSEENFGSNFKPQIEPYEEYDYHYYPCEEYEDYNTPYENRSHIFWDI